MKAIRTHGGINRHFHDLVGMNGRFDTIQAAVILGKWPGYDEEVLARHRIGARYTELLKDVCATPEIRDGNTHVYAQYTLRVPNRDAFAEKLKAKGSPRRSIIRNACTSNPSLLRSDTDMATSQYPSPQRSKWSVCRSIRF